LTDRADQHSSNESHDAAYFSTIIIDERVSAINAMNTISKGIVRIIIQSIHDGFSKDLTCLTIPAITDLIPSETLPRDLIKIPSNIRLAGPDFHVPRSVDLLLGSGATLSLFTVG